MIAVLARRIAAVTFQGCLSLGLATCALAAACTFAPLAQAAIEPTPILSDRGGVLVVRRANRSAVDRYDPSLPTPRLPADTVRAGDRVVVTWSPGRIVEECELLLSVDGGRSFPLRISPELEGDESSYVWRVPNLTAIDARVCLRARIDGREVNGPSSVRITIVADAALPQERWWFHEQGWWNAPEPTIDPSAPSWGSRREELHAAATTEPAEAPVRVAFVSPRARTLPRSSRISLTAPEAPLFDDPLFSRYLPARE